MLTNIYQLVEVFWQSYEQLTALGKAIFGENRIMQTTTNNKTLETIWELLITDYSPTGIESM